MSKIMLLFYYNSRQNKGFRKNKKDKDRKIYTEIWRKDKTKLKGDTSNLNDPFDIGIILGITANFHGKIELNVS